MMNPRLQNIVPFDPALASPYAKGRTPSPGLGDIPAEWGIHSPKERRVKEREARLADEPPQPPLLAPRWSSPTLDDHSEEEPNNSPVIVRSRVVVKRASGQRPCINFSLFFYVIPPLH